MAIFNCYVSSPEGNYQKRWNRLKYVDSTKHVKEMLFNQWHIVEPPTDIHGNNYWVISGGPGPLK